MANFIVEQKRKSSLLSGCCSQTMVIHYDTSGESMQKERNYPAN